MGNRSGSYKSSERTPLGNRDKTSNPTPYPNVKKVPVVSNQPVRTNPNHAPKVSNAKTASHPGEGPHPAGHRTKPGAINAE